MRTERYINPDSDGRFYSLNSMVKTDCHDCEGCSACCVGMGTSIFLEPYDLFLLQKNGEMDLDRLLAEHYIELGVRDGIIEPHIRMTQDTDCCPFLNAQGMCSIHAFRPGICRLFPMGRNYDEDGISYIMLKSACPKKNRTKIRLDKWLGVEKPQEYEQYVLAWHDLRKSLSGFLTEADEKQAGELNLYLLRTFFITKAQTAEQFYMEFYEKLRRVQKAFGL